MRTTSAGLIVAGLSSALPLAAAQAASMQYGGYIDAHAGYGSNPFFNINSPGPSALVGATLSGSILRTTAQSRSILTAEADVSQYLKHYGNTQNYAARLRHNQQLSQVLAVAADINYENAINPSPSFSTRTADLLPQGDLLTIGQRTRRLSGGADLTWEPNERDLFQAGINGSHATFSGGQASAYNSYGANIGYLRTLNSRTKIGVQGTASTINSSIYPDSHSYSLGLQLTQQISPVWRFDGGVSLILQTTRGRSSKTPGFNGSLCGTYPRYTFCLIASRFSAPSGLGGLRTDTQAGARMNYKLTTRSTLDLSATYDISKSEQGVLPRQKYYEAAAAYRRELTPRLSVGVSGRVQGRDYGPLFATGGNKVTGYTGTANVVWKFGRTI